MREARNSLNKDTDPNTGWSYHGARWMAPDTGRWLTPDPPVKAPDAGFIQHPWQLHPYQYVGQNPVMFWDPDGRQQMSLEQYARPFVGHQQQMPLHEAYAPMLKAAGTTISLFFLPARVVATIGLIILAQAKNDRDPNFGSGVLLMVPGMSRLFARETAKCAHIERWKFERCERSARPMGDDEVARCHTH